MSRSGRIVCFGELLLRLNAPGRELLLQSDRFDVIVGGAEANVGVALAQLGHDVRMVSALPPNPLAEGVRRRLRQFGVDLTHIQEPGGRMGLYFMSAGAVLRPSEIIYDRAASAFTMLRPGMIDWSDALADADWLHLSGITPATGEGPAALAVEAAEAATRMGVKLSFDGNYRKNLWDAWSGDAPAVLRAILDHASLAFINERDLGLILGESFEARDLAFDTAFRTFDRLERIACTSRTQTSVDDMSLGGGVYRRCGAAVNAPIDLPNVVDRIGTGDAFAAGVLDALMQGADDQRALDQGMALAALKHALPGDSLLISRAGLNDALAQDGHDVRR